MGKRSKGRRFHIGSSERSFLKESFLIKSRTPLGGGGRRKCVSFCLSALHENAERMRLEFLFININRWKMKKKNCMVSHVVPGEYRTHFSLPRWKAQCKCSSVCTSSLAINNYRGYYIRAERKSDIKKINQIQFGSLRKKNKNKTDYNSRPKVSKKKKLTIFTSATLNNNDKKIQFDLFIKRSITIEKL